MYSEIYLLLLLTGVSCVALMAWSLWLGKTATTHRTPDDRDEVQYKKAA